ncbi:uncharacterized protein LOC62_07G009673 [Vanrija pseudolonga]|uniref:Uncharacterized protein n=1 Tax=Vanrija pseudolonga TaxID=143232 RepID=A0AAF1BLQ2_9TREE|nr:hypothetical protein LOC62_07G009673 [Vanrija pseudolonga]
MTRAGAASLRLAMPTTGADAASGPCTPLPYELALGIPRSLAFANATPEPLTPDVSGLAVLTPSPDDIANRDNWTADEVEVLETILARPPDALHFPPGAMPTPEVLDELARLVLRSFSRGTNPRSTKSSRPPPQSQERPVLVDAPIATSSRQTRRSRTSASLSPSDSSMDADESAAGSTDTESIGSADSRPVLAVAALTTAPLLPSPATSNSSASTVDNDAVVAPCDDAVRTFSLKSWHHSFTETRAKLAVLALADTRLGAEVAERKLTRKERLARPGVKRVSSMDFLDDEDSDTPSEKTGRVLRLSTTLQNTAKETVGLARTASLGPPSGSPQLGTGAETPPLSRGGSFTLSPMTAEPSALGLGLGLGGPRSLSRNSSRSERGSRRPSLLQRGRSFTASDLEAELEAQAVPTITGGDNPSPRTPTISSFNGMVTVSSPSPAHSPAKRRASAPDTAVPRMLRSHSYEPTSGRTRGDERARRGEATESLAPPAAAFNHLGLGSAFEPAATKASGHSSSSWDSDSDRDGHVVIKRPRQARKGRIGALAMTALPAATTEDNQKGSLRSPFEEKPNAMDLA